MTKKVTIRAFDIVNRTWITDDDMGKTMRRCFRMGLKHQEYHDFNVIGQSVTQYLTDEAVDIALGIKSFPEDKEKC